MKYVLQQSDGSEEHAIASALVANLQSPTVHSVPVFGQYRGVGDLLSHRCLPPSSPRCENAARSLSQFPIADVSYLNLVLKYRFVLSRPLSVFRCLRVLNVCYIFDTRSKPWIRDNTAWNSPENTARYESIYNSRASRTKHNTRLRETIPSIGKDVCAQVAGALR